MRCVQQQLSKQKQISHYFTEESRDVSVIL